MEFPEGATLYLKCAAVGRPVFFGGTYILGRRLHRLLARHRAQRPGLTSNWARRRRADSEGRERNERHEGEALFAEAILRVAQPRWAALFAQRSDASLALFIEATQPRDGRAGLRCVTERSFGPPSRSDPPKGRTPGGIRRSACGETLFGRPKGEIQSSLRVRWRPAAATFRYWLSGNWVRQLSPRCAGCGKKDHPVFRPATKIDPIAAARRWLTMGLVCSTRKPPQAEPEGLIGSPHSVEFPVSFALRECVRSYSTASLWASEKKKKRVFFHLTRKVIRSGPFALVEGRCLQEA